MRPAPLLNRPLSAPGVYIDIIKADTAKGLGVNMSAAATPHVEFSAIHAQRALAAVAINNCVILAAYLA